MPDAPAPAVAPASQQDLARRLVRAFYLSGVITVVVGIVLGLVVGPILFAVIGLGLVDFVLARLYASGRIGPLAADRKATETADAAAIAEGDPSFNPYARED